jgi:hypothetical protein
MAAVMRDGGELQSETAERREQQIGEAGPGDQRRHRHPVVAVTAQDRDARRIPRSHRDDEQRQSDADDHL